MEDVDAQGAGHGVASRPVATPSRGPAGPRVSPGLQSRPSNSTPTPRTKSDAALRPPSAGISAWEDSDSPQPGADLLEYLGKTDSADSVGSTSRQPGPITGDGNLTQALLIARRAAEAGASSGGGSADAALLRGASMSLKSQSSGGSYASGGSARGDAATGRQQPGRLSRASTSPGNDPADQQQPQQLQPEPSMSPTPRTEAMETPRDGSETMEGLALASWSVAPGGAGGAAGADSEAERLRGLLYSDDEDGDDEDYQDLMTADDEALFGGADGRGSGAAAAAAAPVAPAAAASRRRSSGGGAGGSSSSSSRHSQARRTDSSTSGSARLSGDGDSAINVPAFGSSNSNETTASGAAGPEPAVYDGTGAAAAAAADGLVACSSTSREMLPPTLSQSQSQKASQPASPVWTVAKDDGAAAAAAAVAAVSTHVSGSYGLGGGAATEALEKVLSGRLSPAIALGPRRTPAPSPPPPQDAAAGPEPPASNPSGQWHPLGASPQPDPLQHPQHQQHQQQLQYSHHFASIPTAQIGEGLRQHQPPRRLYTPGMTNRSPVRGSGYVVSPAAVRSSSPSASPSRGAFSAVHHHHHQQQQQPSHHHAAAGRRLSSPSVALGPISGTTGRPRSPHNSAGGGPGLAPDGGDSAGGGGGPPALNGGVLKMGSWVNGAGGAAAGGGAAGGHGHSTVGRFAFPPAHVQNFPGGQVYRSTPISQVAGSPSDDLGFQGGGAGGAAAAVAGGGGGGLGPSGAVGRTSGSPGRLSARGGRQPRGAAPSTPGGPGGAAALPAPTAYVHDRFGSYSAPARPSTSPHKSRASGGGGGGRPSALAVTGGGGSGISPTAIFGNGALSGPTAETADAPAAAPPPRGVGVPALPPYPVSLGIRHGGMKQAALPGAGGGSFGSPFSTGRQWVGGAAVAPAPDDRTRPFTLAKIHGASGPKESHSPPQQQQQDNTMLHVPLPSPRGAEPASGGGGGGSFAADGPAFDAATAAAESSPLQYQYQHPYLHPQQQVQRKHSLPHLLATPTNQGDPQPASSPLATHGNHNHLPAGPGPGPGPGPNSSFQQRFARASAVNESGLPAVQAPLAGPALRSFSFDMSRRATSRA